MDEEQFEEIIPEIFSFILKIADDKELSAGLSGSYSDGGARLLRDEVEFYKMGRDGIVPPQWKIHISNFQREKDPDYTKYLELKRKFE